MSPLPHWQGDPAAPSCPHVALIDGLVRHDRWCRKFEMAEALTMIRCTNCQNCMRNLVRGRLPDPDWPHKGRVTSLNAAVRTTARA